jgi:hypothetical protein
VFPEEGAFNDVIDINISDHVGMCVDSFVTALFFITPEFSSVVGCVETASPPSAAVDCLETSSGDEVEGVVFFAPSVYAASLVPADTRRIR